MNPTSTSKPAVSRAARDEKEGTELIPAPRYDEVYWTAMSLIHGNNEQTLGFIDLEVVESTCDTENPDHCDACE